MPEIIQGMAEFERKLRELELSMQRKILIETAKAGAEIVLNDAKSRAPRDTGKLAEDMTMRVKAESDINEASVEVGPGKSEWYGFFQEFGTAHNAPQPFLGPALESNRARITEAMKDVMIEAIKKVVR